MTGAPRSEQFDDVYFSADDGLAETRHVFLAGNNLPAAWAGRERFVIAETGFGTGLNFLAAWKLFRETTQAEQRLEYISVEKYPLAVAGIKEALKVWVDEFGYELTKFLENYPDCHLEELATRDFIERGRSLRPAGVRDDTVMDGEVTLRLIFDDVNTALPALQAAVDCWFLDGFKPSANPEMWTETVFENMARLSKPGATFATFTAAGFVRRGLAAAGFEVEKARGFGRKRDMLTGKKK